MNTKDHSLVDFDYTDTMIARHCAKPAVSPCIPLPGNYVVTMNNINI